MEVDHPIRFGRIADGIRTSLESLRRKPDRVRRSREIVDAALQQDQAYYGINTGFGALAQERIDGDRLQQLQRNLVVSHAVGVGELVPREISRLMLQLKIHALGLGYSGVSVETFERLLYFEEHDLIPCIPSRGSVGASGDLAPLAHMSLPLLGLGEFWEDGRLADGNEDRAIEARRRPAREALEEHGLEAIVLQPKDGLSLINGTQLMTAYGVYILEQALQLEKVADVLAAMSLEALQGSIKPFDARMQAVRPHPGQGAVAANVRMLLQDSEILESHRNCGKVQDPYCLRCVPQVHGASRGALDHARSVIQTEINSVTDNPLVFEDGDIVSGGNFHGQPLALALDYAALALSELASISERRTYLLLGGHDGLPKLLMKETGINSGFMIPQYTAAALVSENKVLAHPASVDSIPTSLGQEDHVSMGSISAIKLLDVLRNVEHVLAIELMTAAQALDYRLPLRPGRGVAIAHEYMRGLVPHREEDTFYSEDIESCLRLVRDSEMIDAVVAELEALR